MSVDNRRMSVDNRRMSVDNRRMSVDNGRMPVDNRRMSVDNGRMSADIALMPVAPCPLSSADRPLDVVPIHGWRATAPANAAEAPWRSAAGVERGPTSDRDGME